MYAMAEYRQRRRKKRLIIAVSVVGVMAVAVICIAAKSTVDYKKKYADKYINMYNYTNSSGNGKYNGKGSNWGTKGDSTKTSLLEYFDKKDAADITWAHAVNTKAKLDAAIADEEIMMLEADVMMDPVNDVPIMAHAPANSSDITLSKWLKVALDSSEKKGIKLDFKQTGVLNASMEILKEAVKDIEKLPPIMLNADILNGPNTKPNVTKIVDAEQFFKICGSFKKSILSPGWATAFNVTGNNTGYTSNHTDEMIALLNKYGIEQDVTFPVRASLIPLNPKPMHVLLNQYQKKTTLTVWTSADDTYDPADLAFLRLYTKRVYFDLPADEIKKIKATAKKQGLDFKEMIPTGVVPSAYQKYIP